MTAYTTDPVPSPVAYTALETVDRILDSDRIYGPREAAATVYLAVRRDHPNAGHAIADLAVETAFAVRGHRLRLTPQVAYQQTVIHLAGLDGMAAGVAICGATYFPRSATSPADVTCVDCAEATRLTIRTVAAVTTDVAPPDPRPELQP